MLSNSELKKMNNMKYNTWHAVIFCLNLSFCVVVVDLVRRHAGVLGLSACILSSPYDVPTWMPQLLMDLSAHLNDTQPIEVRLITLLSLLIMNTVRFILYF